MSHLARKNVTPGTKNVTLGKKCYAWQKMCHSSSLIWIVTSMLWLSFPIRSLMFFCSSVKERNCYRELYLKDILLFYGMSFIDIQFGLCWDIFQPMSGASAASRPAGLARLLDFVSWISQNLMMAKWMMWAKTMVNELLACLTSSPEFDHNGHWMMWMMWLWSVTCSLAWLWSMTWLT